MKPPKIKFCPYCKSEGIKRVKGVPRCLACRAVFFLDFSRYTRGSKKVLA